MGKKIILQFTFTHGLSFSAWVLHFDRRKNHQRLFYYQQSQINKLCDTYIHTQYLECFIISFTLDLGIDITVTFYLHLLTHCPLHHVACGAAVKFYLLSLAICRVSHLYYSNFLGYLNFSVDLIGEFTTTISELSRGPGSSNQYGVGDSSLSQVYSSASERINIDCELCVSNEVLRFW